MRYENQKYRKWIAQLPCLLCGDDVSTEAAHVKYSDASIGKVNPGNQKKTHDYFCVPLCGAHHRLQHSGSEIRLWERAGINPVQVALLLFAVFITTGCYGAGLAVVRAVAGNRNPTE